MAMLLLVPLIDYFPTLLFALVIHLLVFMALVIFAISIPFFMLWRSGVFFYRREAGRGILSLSIIVAGMIALPMGRLLGGITILAVGSRLEEAVRLGSGSTTIEAGPAAALYITDVFVGRMHGVAYDTTGRLGELLPSEPMKRPVEWQNSMTKSLKCVGEARHIWGRYWKIRVDVDIHCNGYQRM